jgi:ParB/RepB/Spo0J family partition protein
MDLLLDKIIVDPDRGRKEFGDLAGLADSIKRLGQLQPVVVEQIDGSDQYRLLAGERRLRAHLILGRQTIQALLREELDEPTRKEIELEENLHRLNLTWVEEARLTSEIDQLKRDAHGAAFANRHVEREGWGTADTALSLGVSRPTVSRDLQAARIIELVPQLADEPDRAAALKKFDKLYEALKRERAVRTGALRDDGVLLGDCRIFLAEMEPESVDCIVMDPPYGIALGEINTGRYQARMPIHFDDTEVSTFALLELVYPLLRRVLKLDGHLYTFCSIKFIPEQVALLREAGFDPDHIPLCWVKSRDSLVDYDHRYAGNWEPILFCRGRRLARKRSNVFDYSSVPPTERANVAEKPVALLRELIEMSTQPGEVVLDPFGGSGSTADAAKGLGRRYLVIEQDRNQYNGIITRLDQNYRQPEEESDEAQ